MEDYREFDPYYDLNEQTIYILLGLVNGVALNARKYKVLDDHMRHINNILNNMGLDDKGKPLNDEGKLKRIKYLLKAARENEDREGKVSY